jgi:hypothetical protein
MFPSSFSGSWFLCRLRIPSPIAQLREFHLRFRAYWSGKPSCSGGFRPIPFISRREEISQALLERDCSTSSEVAGIAQLSRRSNPVLLFKLSEHREGIEKQSFGKLFKIFRQLKPTPN